MRTWKTSPDVGDAGVLIEDLERALKASGCCRDTSRPARVSPLEPPSRPLRH